MGQKLPIGWRSFRRFQGKIAPNGDNNAEQQWREWPDGDTEPKEVEHLYSSMLYRTEAGKKIGGYELGYNEVGHREETDFTYRLHLAGYKLLINPTSLMWHLRSPSGGIRHYKKEEMWAECEKFYLKKFNFKQGKFMDYPVVRVFGGLGDHLAATPMLRAMKKKLGYLRVACIYPYLLANNPYIDELLYPGEEKWFDRWIYHDVYKWGYENEFTGKISEAYCKAYNVPFDKDEATYVPCNYEIEWASKYVHDNAIFISTSGNTSVIQFEGTDKTGASNKGTVVKDWLPERWVELVKRLRDRDFEVWQIGGSNDDKIPGCNNYELYNTYRQTMALVAKCKGFVTIDTFLNHAGWAVGKPGVVLFTACPNPNIYSHDGNINLHHPGVCERGHCCYNGSPFATQQLECLSHEECKQSIEVEEVINALERIL